MTYLDVNMAEWFIIGGDGLVEIQIRRLNSQLHWEEEIIGHWNWSSQEDLVEQNTWPQQ